MSNVAKGGRWQRKLKETLVAAGAQVEIAQKAVRWIPHQPWMTSPRPSGKGLVPITMKHDFFGLFDLIVAWPDGRLELWQVTDHANASHRRRKMLAGGFPMTPACVLATYKPRQPFTVFRGPMFADGKLLNGNTSAI